MLKSIQKPVFKITLGLFAFTVLPFISALEVGNNWYSLTAPANWKLDQEPPEDSLDISIYLSFNTFITFGIDQLETPYTAASLQKVIESELKYYIISLISQNSKSIGGKLFTIFEYKSVFKDNPTDPGEVILAYLHSQPTYQFFANSIVNPQGVAGRKNSIETALATLKLSQLTALSFHKRPKKNQHLFLSYDALGRNQTLRKIPTPQFYRSIAK